MNPQLRSYLESIGLKSGANAREAWRYFHGLKGEQRSHAATLRRKQAPTAPTNPQQSEGQRSAPPMSDAERQQLMDEGARREIARRESIRQYAGDMTPPELVQRAIAENWTPSDAATQFLLEERRRPAAVGGSPAIHSRSHEGDCSRDVMAAAVMLRSGIGFENRSYTGRRAIGMNLPQWLRRGANHDDSNRIMELAHRFSDMDAVRICEEALRLEGRSAGSSRQDTIRSAVSTASLSYIFTTSVQAQLLTSYEESADTTMGWCREADVPNFKSNDRIQMGKSGNLQRVPRGGTAKDATIDDGQETYKISRYGEKFTIDEQDIIDDDLGALMDMPMEMGAAAARLRPDLVYAILLSNPEMRDGNNLFDDTNHGNAKTSSGLGVSGKLEAAILAMGVQQQNGVNLNMFPQYLIVPVGLIFTADVLVASAERRNTTATTEYGTKNPLRDLNIQVISDSRLDNGVTDPKNEIDYSGSSTTWYLAARASRHTIEVGYLRGTGRAPTIRNYTLSEGQWGLGWDIKHDIGAKALDWRGLLRAVQ